MTIELNHTIVPARDKVASAKFFSRIFGLSFDESAVKYFARVRVNETITLDFDDDVDLFDIHHYAFHVSDARVRRHFKAGERARTHIRQGAIESRERGAQFVERRQRRLFSRPERPYSRVDDPNLKRLSLVR